MSFNPTHPQVIQSASVGRKFSAPSQLCASTIGGSAHLPTTPSPATASSLATRKGSLCPPAAATAAPPQFVHYTPASAAYSAAQWSGPAHGLSVSQPATLLVSTSQPLGPYPTSLGGQGQIPSQGPLQGFHSTSALQKPVSNPGGPHLRTT